MYAYWLSDRDSVREIVHVDVVQHSPVLNVDRHRQGEARPVVGSAHEREHIVLIVVVAPVLQLRRHVDARALLAASATAGSAETAASAASTATTARSAASARVLREAVRHAQVHVVVRRLIGCGVVIVAIRAVEIRKRDEPQERKRCGADTRGWNLVFGKRKAGDRIDQLTLNVREIPGAHRCGWNGRVLIEQIAAARPVVCRHEVRSAIAFIDVRNSDRTAKRHAEPLPRVRRLLCRGAGMKLIRRAVQRRSAERVVRLRVVRVLSATATGEHEISAPSTRAARTAASTRPASAGPAASAGPPNPWRHRIRVRPVRNPARIHRSPD